MTLKSDAKFEQKLTCCLENDMRNLVNFDQSTRKFQNWNFDGILLPRVENIWPYNSQRSYLSWKWRMIQKLKLLKLSYKIEIELQKYRGVILHDTKEIYKFWKLTCGLKKDLRNLANFYQSTWKCQNWDFDGILLSKVEKVWP